MPKIHFIHLRTASEKGGTTIAYEWIDGKSGQPVEHGGNAVRYAIAQCNPKDVFNKARGRLIAAGRIAHPDRGCTYNVAVEGTNPIGAILADAGFEQLEFHA